MKSLFLMVSLALPIFITGSLISKPGFDTSNSYQQLKNIYEHQKQELQKASRESAQQSAQTSAEKSSQQSVQQSSQESSEELADNSRQAQATQQRRHSTQRQQEDQKSQNYEQQYLQQNQQQQYEKQHHHQKKYQPVQRKPAHSNENSHENASQETREQIYSNRDVYRVPAQYLFRWLSQQITPNKRSSQEMKENISSYNRMDKPGETLESLVSKLRQRKYSSSSLNEDNSKQSNSQEANERISRESMENNVKIEKRSNSLYSHSRKWNSPRSSAENNQTRSNEVISSRQQKILVVPVISKRDIAKIHMKAYETMKSDSNERKKQFHKEFENAARTYNEDVYMNATQLLTKNQYLSEEHTVKTEDGYYLTLFRITPQHKIRVQNRPVVFLMHGLLGSADDWLLMGPRKSLAYLLTDAGYDVWLGNARGNKYARHHASKHPSQDDFWHFTTDEIALQDLPAMIDYVLKTSKQQKLYYVAHSQGTTAFFALAATQPAYNEKIIMMYALSPMAYMSNVRSSLFRIIAPSSQYHDTLVQQMGHGEFQPSKQVIRAVGGEMCEQEVGCKDVCSNIYFVISGVNVNNLDTNLIPVIMSHLPAGASTRQMKQYGQAVDSQEFMKYDYGSEINQAMYGTPQPPKYRMEKVSTPVSLYYSEDDWISHPKDVKRLQDELPNVRDAFKVPEENHFSSMDFQFSKRAPEVVYQRLVKSIQEQESS